MWGYACLWARASKRERGLYQAGQMSASPRESEVSFRSAFLEFQEGMLLPKAPFSLEARSVLQVQMLKVHFFKVNNLVPQVLGLRGCPLHETIHTIISSSTSDPKAMQMPIRPMTANNAEQRRKLILISGSPPSSPPQLQVPFILLF